ncbi:hypothetical protein [Luteimonas sp. R10]|uniref:hypothetical protein n=1 Tax=Luteimonas sp. R10 TaxID=3108176 RepID=UPI00308F8CA1|nr:hypothetical protein U3649_15185 [Luteimonas sp. R10]
MTTPDPLQCTYEDARRAQLRDGIALDTVAKVAFFEEMVAFAARFGARDRLADWRTVDSRGRSPAQGSAG